MKVFAAKRREGLLVLDLKLLAVLRNSELTESEIKEAFRSQLKEDLEADHVWFEDEVGTILDPIKGPIPQYGPRADAAKTN